MKTYLFLVYLLSVFLTSCNDIQDDRIIFFIHNRFIENHDLSEPHPEYGIAEYNEILSKFERNGFKVISEKRNGDMHHLKYAEKVRIQIDSLIENGVQAENITVVGTSKGGYIAQYVSTYANNPKLNFVFVASFREEDMENLPEINYCGNILTIYEKSDAFGVSSVKRKEASSCEIKHFKEVVLDTGLKHGFQFKAMNNWLNPIIKWANGNYD